MALRRPGRRDHDEGVRFSRTLTIALFIFSALLIAFDRPDSRPGFLAVTRTAITDVAAPLLDLTARPIRAIGNIGPYWRRQAELVEENANLQDQLTDTRYWRDLALRLRDERDIYREALNLTPASEQARIGAWVLADPTGPFVRSRIVGAGAGRGVGEGNPVLNVYGLVGHVVEVGRRSSRVLLLTDLNSRVPVMADRSNARAVLTGDNTNFPRLDYLGRDADLQEGDRIVTSGDDGILPRGLPVGTAARDRNGRWRVRLFADNAPVDFVWVLPYDRLPPPEEDPVIDQDSIETPGEINSPSPDQTADADSVPDSGETALMEDGE